MLPTEAEDYHLRKLLDKVQIERGLDCQGFRRSYVARRVATRLMSTGVATIRDYTRRIDQDPAEYAALINALTVNVSEFFRDRPVFRYVQAHVVPSILDAKSAKRHEVIRIWSAGCSTGEEPYTLGMLFLDAMASHKGSFQLAITGTDIDMEVLAFAKRGRYPLSKLDQIPADFRRKYVVVDGAEFEIVPEVREFVKFRRLDLFADNAIGALDLLACRNVMIYFDRAKQILVFHKFMGALRKGGFLVIGKSEKLASEIVQELETCSLPERVYRRPT